MFLLILVKDVICMSAVLKEEHLLCIYFCKVLQVEVNAEYIRYILAAEKYLTNQAFYMKVKVTMIT